jgi:hypothetical protein
MTARVYKPSSTENRKPLAGWASYYEAQFALSEAFREIGAKLFISEIR